MAEYSKIFRTKSYLQAGDFVRPGPDPELMELISKVLDTMPEDQRARFRNQVEKYQTWANLPQYLRDQLPTPRFSTESDGD